MLTSRSTDSQAVMFWDTYSPNQHCRYIWHVESCGLNNFLLRVLLWTRVIGTCQQDYLWLNHSALHLQHGGNRVGEGVKLFRFVLLSASVYLCLQFTSCFPSPRADCLGLRFTWLHSVFDNFPSLLNFALRLRCATGLCPRELEDYGCSCRYVAAGNPVDPLDMWVRLTEFRGWRHVQSELGES